MPSRPPSHAVTFGARLALTALAAWAAACAPDETRTERARASNDLGVLHGTITLPSGSTPVPAVLIVPGSGPTDRDGNAVGLRTDSYAQLAEALAARGIASLRYDKAGVGESVGAFPTDESEFRFEMGAHDVALWVRVMRADRRIGRITLVGHSEGAELAVLAHAEAPVDALVTLEGAGRPIGKLLREQLGTSLKEPALRDRAFDIIARLERGETTDDVPVALLGLFRPSIQPYWISWMKHEPADELGRVNVPVAVIHGTTDLQVPVSEARILAAGRPDTKLEEIRGMNHVLKLDDAETLERQTMRSYVDPSYPMPSELVDAIATLAGR